MTSFSGCAKHHTKDERAGILASAMSLTFITGYRSLENSSTGTHIVNRGQYTIYSPKIQLDKPEKCSLETLFQIVLEKFDY